MAEIDLRGAILSLLGKLESKDNGILKYHPSSRINFELLREIVSQFENADQFKSAFKSMCLRTLNENPAYSILHKHALRMYIFGLNVILADLEHSFVDERPCATCNELSDPDRTLLCDCCNDPYHTFCLALPDDIPTGTWFCRDCSILEQNYLLQRALSALDRRQHPQQRVRQTRKQVHVRISVSSSSEDNDAVDERAKRRANRQQRQPKKPEKPKRAARISKQQSSSSSTSSSSYSSSSSSSSSDWDQKQERLLSQSLKPSSVFKKEFERLKQRQTTARPVPIKPETVQSALRKSNRELQGEADALARAIDEANAEIRRLDQTTKHLSSRMEGLGKDRANHRNILQQLAEEEVKKGREIQLMSDTYEEVRTNHPDHFDIHAQLQQRLNHSHQEAGEIQRLRSHHESDLQHIERALKQLTEQYEKDCARMQALKDDCQRHAMKRDELFQKIQRQQEQVRQLAKVEIPPPILAPLQEQRPQVQQPPPQLIQHLQQWPAQWEPRTQQQQQQLPREVVYPARVVPQPEYPRENPFNQQLLSHPESRLRDSPQQRPFHLQPLSDSTFRDAPNSYPRNQPYRRGPQQNGAGDFEFHSQNQRDVLREAFHNRDSYRPHQREPYTQIRESANQREFQPDFQPNQRGLPNQGDYYDRRDSQSDDRYRRDFQDRDVRDRSQYYPESHPLRGQRPGALYERERASGDRYNQDRFYDHRDSRQFNQHREQRTNFFRDYDQRQHFDFDNRQLQHFRPYEHERRDEQFHNGRRDADRQANFARNDDRREDYQRQRDQFSRNELYDPDVTDEDTLPLVQSSQLPVQSHEEFCHKGPITQEELKLDRPVVVQPEANPNATSPSNNNAAANATDPLPRPPANAVGALVLDQATAQWRPMKRLAGRRLLRSKVQYKIDWGEPGREAAWAFVEEMHNCDEIIKTFEQKFAAQLLKVSKLSGGKRKEL